MHSLNLDNFHPDDLDALRIHLRDRRRQLSAGFDAAPDKAEIGRRAQVLGEAVITVCEAFEVAAGIAPEDDEADPPSASGDSLASAICRRMQAHGLIPEDGDGSD